MPMSRFFRIAAALLCLCMLTAGLCGCREFTFEQAQAPDSPLPSPDTSAMSAPLGDSRARYSIRTTLYYRTADGQLSSALRLINVDEEDDPLRLILESLLEAPYSSSGLLPIAPEGTAVERIVLSGGIAVVDLNANALSQGEEYFYLARAAIAKTLLGLDTVECVNVLVEGRAVRAAGMPLGALTEQDADAAMGYIQLQSEKMLLESEGGYINRNAVLYIPGDADAPLAPAYRALRLYENDDIFTPLIDAFTRSTDPALYPAELLAQVRVQEEVDGAGRRVLTLLLPGELAACDAQARLVPALVCTFCSFVPDIDAVRVYVGNEMLGQAGGIQADEDGLFDPLSLKTLAGSKARLYCMAADGSLAAVEHVLEGSSLSARTLLCGLMDAVPEEGLTGIFPENTGSEDILGVRIEENTAHVNLSAELYSACQPFSHERERALIFGIVNTLVDNLDTVTRVQFYIDGLTADTFAGNISITTPLMANPGLVRK